MVVVVGQEGYCLCPTTSVGDDAETWGQESFSPEILAHPNCSLDDIGLVSYETGPSSFL